jgi:hypothetical protein
MSCIENKANSTKDNKEKSKGGDKLTRLPLSEIRHRSEALVVVVVVLEE